jgi:hypothetical protein
MLCLTAVCALALAGMSADKPAPKMAGNSGKPAWSMNATIIEACSCPMFCQCYFTDHPAGHASMEGMGHDAHSGHEGHNMGAGGEHYCRFNNAFRVNKGWHNGVKLDGAKFWVAGDLGDDFSKAHMDWAVVTFDKAMTPDQRKAVGEILGHLYPVQWNSMKTAEGDISWTANKQEAHAKLDDGKTAEVKLKATVASNNTQESTVIKNLKYWGAPKNDGFVLMPNEVEAYRVGDKPFEFKGTNGFMITFDINSNNAPPAAGS